MVERSSASEKDGPEYTLAETIDALERWVRTGRCDTVAAAYGALHWLRVPAWDDGPDENCELSVTETVEQLNEWVNNTVPNLPEDTGTAALYWLRRLQPPPSGGG